MARPPRAPPSPDRPRVGPEGGVRGRRPGPPASGGRTDELRSPEVPLGVAAGLVAGAAYLLAANPSLGFQDNGELVAAAYQLGVPHPTGFPVLMLAGKLATLVPLGTIAMRTALLSVASAAAAVGLLGALSARLASALGVSRASAAAAGACTALVVGASPTVVQAATGLEAYAPALATLALMLLLACPRTGAPRPRAVALLGLCFGLGATTHVTVRLHGLLPLGSALLRTERRRRALLLALGAALLGSLAVLYVPLASLRDPPMDWGDPETLARLWDHLSGGRIRRSFVDRMLSPAWLRLDAAALWQLVAEDLGGPALVLAMLGLGGLLARARAAAALLVLVALADAAYDVLVNPMGLPDRQVAFPLEAVLAVLAGIGAAALAGRRDEPAGGAEDAARTRPRALARGALPFLAAAFAVATPILGAARHPGPGFGPSGIVASACSVPPRSAILCTSDSLCGGLAWAQYVEGARPDVLALPRQHLWDRATLEARLSRHAADLPDEASGGLDLERALGLLAPRAALFWERGGDEAWLRRRLGPHPLSPEAPPPLFRVGGPGRPAERAARDLEAAARRWFGPAGPADRDGRAVLSSMLEALAATTAEWGDHRAAAALLGRAFELSARASVLVNMAALEVRAGDDARALVLAEAAVELEPGNLRALVQAGRLHLAASRDAAAAPLFERARALCPTQCAEPLEGLGILAARAGDLERAEALLGEALRRDPTLEDARTNLRLLEELGGRL